LGVASERMMGRAKTLSGRGLYFDLVSLSEAMAKHQPTNTPAIPLFYALETQLARIDREGGVTARWRRHDAMRRRVEEWCERRGVAYLPPEGRRSWSVSCLKVPEGKSAKQVVGALRRPDGPSVRGMARSRRRRSGSATWATIASPPWTSCPPCSTRPWH